jgi:hypothetical protein
MNEREFGTKLKENLNYGLSRLEPDIFKRLEAARKRALEAYRPEEVHGLRLAGIHGVDHHHGRSRHWMRGRWVSVALLLAALATALYWQQQQQDTSDDDVDAALLSSDLPLNAYLDRGFQAWLDRSSQH